VSGETLTNRNEIAWIFFIVS